ncbi:uncharacterized protein EV422DRAFT_260381 [Fimicolochytrium jonesii]|uniref:uncharacterized protein n=1 Tax=Fimicolochytrium jonesii TaxID=1396493 RepID=UPI0022FEC58B|nr:uncharacterized protein EV422DRAFT_260381 [Fimicolochytrium jonesii]KAI8817008.1 hypothetical protein EV422DRAFT_260381 [Fimicolochytrium jonesii]
MTVPPPLPPRRSTGFAPRASSSGSPPPPPPRPSQPAQQQHQQEQQLEQLKYQQLEQRYQLLEQKYQQLEQKYQQLQAQQQQQRQPQQQPHGTPPTPPQQVQQESFQQEQTVLGTQNAGAASITAVKNQPPLTSSTAWTEPLFYTDGRGTPTFDAMMKEFFSRLDTQGTGYITPEQYSSFLDANEFLTEWNAWKKCLKADWLYTAEDMADYELKSVFEGFNFDHKVVVRNAANKQLPGGGMPLLSLAGFTDHMALEYASSADEHLRGLNSALLHYGVWPERGPIPRHVLPPSCPPQLQSRIDEATLRCTANAKSKLNALKVQASLTAMGEQNAVELADSRRWVTTTTYY